MRLHVSVASHCPLLQPVADLLERRISSMYLRKPQLVYVGNVTARHAYQELVAHDLVNNVAYGVRWHDATQYLGTQLQSFLEMPPGHILMISPRKTSRA